jgi:hypothetical protein
MGGKFADIVMGVAALAMVVAFFAVPAVKLKDPALVIVLVIGVVAIAYNFIDVLRGKDG